MIKSDWCTFCTQAPAAGELYGYDEELKEYMTLPACLACAMEQAQLHGMTLEELNNQNV